MGGQSIMMYWYLSRRPSRWGFKRFSRPCVPTISTSAPARSICEGASFSLGRWVGRIMSLRGTSFNSTS